MTNKKQRFPKVRKALKTFSDFAAGIDPSTFSSDVTVPYVHDRPADDEYLRKIKHSRGAVKQLALNEPMTASAIEYRTQMAVGTTIRIKPSPLISQLGWNEQDKRDFRRSMRDLWKMFLESDERWIDAAGLHTVSELAAQHTRIFETEGEAMAQVNELGAARRSPLSFNVGNVNPARVRTPANLGDQNNRRVADGKLVSRRGYPLGFYVHEYDMNDAAGRFAGGTEKYNFIPTRNSETGREQFIHSYVQTTSDLSRGISKLASCVNISCQKSKYIDAALEDAISKAGLTFVLKSTAQNLEQLMDVLGPGADDPMQEMMDRSLVWHKKMNIKHRGAKIARLLHGEEMEGFSADQAGGATFETFNDTIDVIAAACHGLSLEEYRQRWDKTNYSGARAGKIYVYNMIQLLRMNAPWRLVRKIYCLFVEDMILQGRVQLPGFGSDAFGAWQFFLQNKEALTCVDFFGAPKDEIDRAKMAAAYTAEKDLGVATKESYCEEVLGEYWEDRVDQVVDEVKTTYEKIEIACGETPSQSIADVVMGELYPDSQSTPAPVSPEPDESEEDDSEEDESPDELITEEAE